VVAMSDGQECKIDKGEYGGYILYSYMKIEE
jgi:hypothetical protein